MKKRFKNYRIILVFQARIKMAGIKMIICYFYGLLHLSCMPDKLKSILSFLVSSYFLRLIIMTKQNLFIYSIS